MYRLYGNGIDDDSPAIQEMLDSGISEVILPAPEKFYLIKSTLKIHSNQSLKLGRSTTIRLADGANCPMIENDDFDNFSENISIEGGIWDMNNKNQWPNPYYFPDSDGKTFFDKTGTKRRDFTMFRELKSFMRGIYTGMCMVFCRIRRFELKNMTIKNPVIYGVQMGYIEDFTVRDIFFDYTEGAPKLWNMDGIHVEGNCKNGSIVNLKGACHDDMVALTADDGLYGPIENVLVDGIFAERSHSAVRILSHGVPVRNVTIKNVYGSYYVYCIGITKYHGGEDERGVVENIVIENVSASSSEGTADVGGGKRPIIWVQKGVDVNGLSIRGVHRVERAYPVPLFKLDEGASVKNLALRDVYQRSLLDEEVGFISLEGEVSGLIKENLISE